MVRQAIAASLSFQAGYFRREWFPKSPNFLQRNQFAIVAVAIIRKQVGHNVFGIRLFVSEGNEGSIIFFRIKLFDW